jgi:hypothetical protein
MGGTKPPTLVECVEHAEVFPESSWIETKGHHHPARSDHRRHEVPIGTCCAEPVSGGPFKTPARGNL